MHIRTVTLHINISYTTDTTLQTRSGSVFSSFVAAPFRAQHAVNFGTLLQESMAVEGVVDVEDAGEPKDAPTLLPKSTPGEAAGPSQHHPSSNKRPAPEDSPGPEKSKKQRRQNFNRRKKRNAAFDVGGSEHTPSERTLRDVAVTADAIPTTLRTEDLPVKHGAYTAKSIQLADPQKVWTVEDLIASGFELVEWDGR